MTDTEKRPATTIGSRLRKVRQQACMTQTEFAAACGVSTRTLSRYEGGESAPDADFLLALKPFGVDANWLLHGESHVPPATSPPASADHQGPTPDYGARPLNRCRPDFGLITTILGVAFFWALLSGLMCALAQRYPGGDDAVHEECALHGIPVEQCEAGLYR